jgi:Spy/CpxP family protein refolding chaperone
MRKPRVALLATALLVPARVFAQGGQGEAAERPGRAHRHMPNVCDQLKHLSKELKLSNDQKPQVKQILQDQHDQMQQLWQNSSGSRRDNMQKMRETHENASSKIRATDEQKATYDKLEAERQQRWAQRHGGGGEGNRPPQQ